MSSLSMVKAPAEQKADADFVFYELTRSICPTCRRVIDGHILLRDNKVYMRKRCPEHGRFEGLIYSDAEAYISSSRYNKPGTIPLQFSTEIEHGCPHDCGLCPDHQQHACLGIIEVNSACNMDCPLCFADAGAGYNLTLQEVEEILAQYDCDDASRELVDLTLERGARDNVTVAVIKFEETTAFKSRIPDDTAVNYGLTGQCTQLTGEFRPEIRGCMNHG